MRPVDLVLTPKGLRLAGLLFPCTVGHGGLSGHKREGDGTTPRGAHRVVGVLYRPDRVARPSHWALPIRPRDGWSDDADDPRYNRMIQRPHSFGHERLWRADRLYDIILVTDWNWPDARKGRGSAIFVHRWRKPGHPTEGCVALHPRELGRIAARIGPGTRLIVP